MAGRPRRFGFGRLVLIAVVAVGAVYVILQLLPADQLVRPFDEALRVGRYSDGAVMVPEISEFLPVGMTREAACARLRKAGFSCNKARPMAVPAGFDELYVGYKIPWAGYFVFGYFEFEVGLEVKGGRVGNVSARVTHTAL